MGTFKDVELQLQASEQIANVMLQLRRMRNDNKQFRDSQALKEAELELNREMLELRKGQQEFEQGEIMKGLKEKAAESESKAEQLKQLRALDLRQSALDKKEQNLKMAELSSKDKKVAEKAAQKEQNKALSDFNKKFVKKKVKITPEELWGAEDLSKIKDVNIVDTVDTYGYFNLLSEKQGTKVSDMMVEKLFGPGTTMDDILKDKLTMNVADISSKIGVKDDEAFNKLLDGKASILKELQKNGIERLQKKYSKALRPEEFKDITGSYLSSYIVGQDVPSKNYKEIEVYAEEPMPADLFVKSVIHEPAPKIAKEKLQEFEEMLSGKTPEDFKVMKEYLEPRPNTAEFISILNNKLGK